MNSQNEQKTKRLNVPKERASRSSEEHQPQTTPATPTITPTTTSTMISPETDQNPKEGRVSSRPVRTIKAPVKLTYDTPGSSCNLKPLLFKCHFEGCGLRFKKLLQCKTHERMHQQLGDSREKKFKCGFAHCNKGKL